MKKVLILGLAETLKDAPIEYEGEIWTCNDGAMRRTLQHGKPFIDAMFDMHNLNVATSAEKQSVTLCETFNIPVFGVQEYPWLRNSFKYPLAEAMAIANTDLFSNVICYMIAKAILDGYTHIDMYGVHLHPDQRDYAESALVHMWLGIAMGRNIGLGIQDYNAPGNALLHNGNYWTGEGAYGHWNEGLNLEMEKEARDNPIEAPKDEMPVHEVAKP
jgi:hypothetical protein